MPSIDNIHADKPIDQIQATFAGLNATDPPHAIGADEVQTSTNIDFTLEGSAACVRRGSVYLTQVTSLPGSSCFLQSSELNSTEVDAPGVLYVGEGKTLYRIVGTTATAIATASSASSTWCGHAFGSFAYFMGGDGTAQVSQCKDDSVSTTEWIVESPRFSPIVHISTGVPVPIQTTLTASEGSASGASNVVFICDASTFRTDLEQAITPTILYSNAAYGSVGLYGVISVQAAISNPKNINRVSMDFGLGGWNDYYHNELDMTSLAEGSPDPDTLVQSIVNIPTYISGTNTISGPITAAERAAVSAAVKKNPLNPTSRFSTAKQVFNTWIIPLTNFETIFQDAGPGGWDAVTTGRIIIEGTGTYSCTITNWQIQGGSNFSLSDTQIGYTWWETWAQIDPNSGAILGESFPSPSSPLAVNQPERIQYANATITDSSTALDPNSGITHRIYYRQGGLLGTPYAVGTVPIATGTFADLLTDVNVLTLDFPLNQDVSAISSLARAPNAIADYYDRLFVISSNTLSWSLPGQLAEFPLDSYVIMSDNGDPGMALIVWLPKLVIINDHSVYEMMGQSFEAPNQNYILVKTGSRHGSKSRLVPIKTPYGIPLLDYDGLFMYTPGSGGFEQSVDWVMQKVGDMWRGQGATDPAGYKGNRIPAIDFSNIQYACAEYADSKLYLGLPCGSGTGSINPSVPACTHLLVCDFRYSRVYLFEYPFNFNALNWSQFDNTLYALGGDGNIYRIESGTVDAMLGTGTQDIEYVFKTRSWPAPTDILLENVAIQYRGGNGQCVAYYDQTNTATIGTLTASNKVWTIPTAGGSIANDVSFQFGGTQQAGTQNVIYNLDWDLWMQPKKVVFYRTDYDDNGTPEEKIYDVHFTDMQVIPAGTASGTVLATAYVDDSPVSTFTITGFNEKARYEFSYPAETYGNIEFTVYNATVGQFKLYGHHVGARNEPPRTTVYDSDRVIAQEQWWREVLSDINPLGGTITAVWMLDEVAQSTFTISNSLSQGTTTTSAVGRTVYPNSIQSQEPYGKCSYMRYSSTKPFKHYRTWYHTENQPDRLTFSESSHDTLPSVGVVKTWLFDANPQGGTTTGTVYLDGVALMTASFTGTVRHTYETALPNITTGKTLKAVYTSSVGFKNWRTHFEIDPKPFYKNAWNVIYRKIGGATQLDMARFWEIEVETTNTTTITNTWYADGVITDTFTITNPPGHFYYDRQPFPPGVFAYLMQNAITATDSNGNPAPFHLWNTRLEMERIGVKGFSPISIPGTPEEQQTVTSAEGQVGVKPMMSQYYT